MHPVHELRNEGIGIELCSRQVCICMEEAGALVLVVQQFESPLGAQLVEPLVDGVEVILVFEHVHVRIGATGLLERDGLLLLQEMLQVVGLVEQQVSIDGVDRPRDLRSWFVDQGFAGRGCRDESAELGASSGERDEIEVLLLGNHLDCQGGVLRVEPASTRAHVSGKSGERARAESAAAADTVH